MPRKRVSSPQKDKLISIVVPIFNEEESLSRLFQRLESVIARRTDLNWEFVFVNDGSKDRSGELLEEYASENTFCKVIQLSRNFGQQIALTAGLDFAHGDIVCVVDADLQDPPELLLDMITEIERGYNIVYGQRSKRLGESWFKVNSARLFYRTLASLTNVSIPLDTGDFRAMDRKVVDTIRLMRENPRFLRGMFAWVGFRAKPLLYLRDPRVAGETKYNFKRMFKFALDALFSFSDVPLRLAAYFGFAVVGLGMLGITYVIFQYLFFSNYIPGVSAVLFVLLVVGGVQLITLGILGQYVGRIFDQSKRRPMYIIERTSNLPEATEVVAEYVPSPYTNGNRNQPHT